MRSSPVSPLKEAFSIRKLEQLPEQILALEAQAVAEGFRFLTRLITEWENHANRFDQPGESLWGVFFQGQLIAIGGLSRDPYAGQQVGRLRRLYVAPSMRGRKMGQALVEQLLKQATTHFQTVRLSTDTFEGARFYLRCGFQAIDSDSATHQKSLSENQPLP